MTGTGIELWILKELTGFSLKVAVKSTYEVTKWGMTHGADFVSRHPWASAWYLSRKVSLQANIERCFEEYKQFGFLDETLVYDDRGKLLQTSDAFLRSNIVLDIYRDMAVYMHVASFTAEEIGQVGLTSRVCIQTGLRENLSEGYRMDLFEERLRKACDGLGMDYPFKNGIRSDPVWCFADPIRTGSRAFENAFIVEGERRESGKEPKLVLVLARVLGLLMLCGLSNVWADEIPLVLGLAPKLETIARSRISALRSARPSEVLNSNLFGGVTENGSEEFPNLDTGSSLVVVGHMDQEGTVLGLPEYRWIATSSPLDMKRRFQPAHRVPLLMSQGWAELLKHRNGHSAASNDDEYLARLVLPQHMQDSHGNEYPSDGRLPLLNLSMQWLDTRAIYVIPGGLTMFDPSGTTLHESQYTHTKTTSGGIIGTDCECDGQSRLFKRISRDNAISMRRRAKELATKLPLLEEKTTYGCFGKNVLIEGTNRVQGQCFEHTKRLSRYSIGVLWCPTDWATGVLMLQYLPQNSYLQGRKECLHCALEKAIELGCQEVIACGGNPSDNLLVPSAAAATQSSDAHLRLVQSAPNPVDENRGLEKSTDTTNLEASCSNFRKPVEKAVSLDVGEWRSTSGSSISATSMPSIQDLGPHSANGVPKRKPVPSRTILELEGAGTTAEPAELEG